MTFTVKANAGENKIALDTKYMPDPFNYKLSVNVKNQSTKTLYFKVSVDNANWQVADPSDGKLGSIGAASNKWFVITLSRAKPSSDVTENVTLKFEAYTDDSYTTKVDEGSLDLTFIIGDFRNWDNVTVYDFEDGTSQGWTLGSYWSVSGSASVEAGGYSLQHYRQSTGTITSSISRDVTLPNNSQVVLNLLMAARQYAYSTSYNRLYYLKIKVNGNEVFVIENMENMGYYLHPSTDTTITRDWVNIGADISEYAGQSVTIEIEISWYSNNLYNKLWMWIDDIIIAGKG